MQKRILLVEDEDHLHEAIKMNLEMENYMVNSVYDGKNAIAKFKEGRYDLVILDVMLPGVNGFDICEAIRLEDKQTPILFLTAKNSSQDRVNGLKVGGYDYIGKPFNLEELILRSENLIKRSVNTGFSGGEKKRSEILQMSLLEPKLAILDETDSGLDIDALKIVANGVNNLKNSNRSFLIITHYQRLLNYIVPDKVHVLSKGKIVKSGNKNLALELEKKGYEGII